MKKAELQAQFDELSSSITNHTVFGQGRIIKAFPEMKHRDYFELIQELKKNSDKKMKLDKEAAGNFQHFLLPLYRVSELQLIGFVSLSLVR